MTVPQWLRNAVVDGLQGLLILRLKGAPANDTAKAVANAWVTVLANRPIAWEEAMDLPRIRHAFMQLAGTCEHWPAPALLLQAMPPREVPNTLRLNAPRSREIPPAAKEALDKLMKRIKA